MPIVTEREIKKEIETVLLQYSYLPNTFCFFYGFFIGFIIYGIIDRKSVYQRADYCFIGVIRLSAAGGYELRLGFIFLLTRFCLRL